MVQQPTSKLHKEIVRFANRNLEACESSHAEVQNIRKSLLTVVNKRYPTAKVEMYGSRSTGLYLASSDMDVMLMGVPVTPAQVAEALKQLHGDLGELNWVHKQHLVLGARIPMLKLTSKSSIAVGVTISASPSHTGLMTRDLVLSYLNQMPQIAPLVVVLKSFLRDLSLNDIYTGGLSSYCLVVLLFSFMSECESFGYATCDCGHLLVGFLNNFLWRFESNLTHVDDPLAPSYFDSEGNHVAGENIMHSCYQIGRVCACFKRALYLLSPEFTDWDSPETPLLAQIFGSTRYTQTDEFEPDRLRMVAGPTPTPEPVMSDAEHLGPNELVMGGGPMPAGVAAPPASVPSATAPREPAATSCEHHEESSQRGGAEAARPMHEAPQAASPSGAAEATKAGHPSDGHVRTLPRTASIGTQVVVNVNGNLAEPDGVAPDRNQAEVEGKEAEVAAEAEALAEEEPPAKVAEEPACEEVALVCLTLAVDEHGVCTNSLVATEPPAADVSAEDEAAPTGEAEAEAEVRPRAAAEKLRPPLNASPAELRHWQKLNGELDQAKAAEAQQPVQQVQQRLQLLQKGTNLQLHLTEALQALEPTDHALRNHVFLMLQSAAQQWGWVGWMEVFGSTACNLHANSSDIDLMLLQAAHPSHAQQCAWVNWLAKAFGASGEFEANPVVRRVRVPIVKLHHRRSGLQCDVSVGNYSARHKTALLRKYVQLDSRVRPLCLLVKHWAKSCDLCDPFHGTLSSYAWVLMVIHHLQTVPEPPVLPRLDPARFRSHPKRWPNEATLGELLASFFLHYAAFPLDRAVSVGTATTPLRPVEHSAPFQRLCVIDPVATGDDLGRHLTPETQQRLMTQLANRKELVDAGHWPWRKDSSQ